MDNSDGLEHLKGQPVLVEAGPLELTGTVASFEDGSLTVSCDQECGLSGSSHRVSFSVFAPDALYRISGEATAGGKELVCRSGMVIERIQRRLWPRRHMDLSVTLCPVDGGTRLEGVPGRTIDVSIGGVCVETLRPLAGEGDPMVILNLPDGSTIVSDASTVDSEDLGDGWRYHLAFRDLDAADAGRLAAITTP